MYSNLQIAESILEYLWFWHSGSIVYEEVNNQIEGNITAQT